MIVRVAGSGFYGLVLYEKLTGFEIFPVYDGCELHFFFEDSAQFSAGAPCDPDKAQLVAQEIHKHFADFAQNGPTQEELANAKKQVANNLDTQMKEPTYWWRILQHHDLHHRDLAEEQAEKEAFQSYTTNRVQAVFQKYYQPSRQFTVTVVPAEDK